MGLKHFSNWPLNIELKKRLKLFKMGKDTLKQITKCTATLSAILSLRHILLFSLSDANKTCLRVKLSMTAQMILENWLKQYIKFNQL